MKKILCTLLSLTMLTLLVGCQKEKPTETTTDTIPAPVSTTVPTTAYTTVPTTASTTAAPTTTTAPTTTATTAAPVQPTVNFAYVKEKTGNVLKAESEKKIWAGIVGDAYLLLRNISDTNEWGETGRVYELHCAQFTGQYSMWSDGYWDLSDDGTKLTLTPKNQSKNGSIGVEAGNSKTYKGQNGVFTIDFSFEQGGKATIKIDLNKVAK